MNKQVFIMIIFLTVLYSISKFYFKYYSYAKKNAIRNRWNIDWPIFGGW